VDDQHEGETDKSEKNENMKNINRSNVVGYLFTGAKPLISSDPINPPVVNNKDTAIPVLIFGNGSAMDHLKVSCVLTPECR
jgi:hypothetical protein